MKTVALVSGGKDSCYSMLLCQQHGHDIVALANLLPSDSSTDDIDSYMYQTVGHQLISAYACCTGLPLYRRRIMGQSTSQDLAYSSTVGDEVEDLYCLLAYIKEQQPEVEAVASGAIASDYQRLRVEQVCSRLGLTSLAYMWHQPQRQLLSDMIASGIDAILVKVAALGLDPHKHLGRSLAALQPHLLRLADTYGCNPCGEGGEYETLTLDCPLFTAGRLELTDWRVVLASQDSIAPVGLLHPTHFHIVSKPDAAQQLSADDATVIQVPEQWCPPLQQPSATAGAVAVAAPGGGGAHRADAATSSSEGVQVEVQLHQGASTLHVMAAARLAHTPQPSSTTPQATAAALRGALLAVQQQLAAAGCTWLDTCFVHLYLRDMAHFGAANAAYCQVLPAVGPPARACVQADLPEDTPVLLDVLVQPIGRGLQSAAQHTPALTPAGAAAAADRDPGAEDATASSLGSRRVLHVQSISDWAPSCIGPYSQAVSVGGLIYMAGQIPLDPGSMALVTNSFPAAAWRTLVSCQAVAIALRSCIVAACLSLTVYCSPEGAAAAGAAEMLAVLQVAWEKPQLLDSYSAALQAWQQQEQEPSADALQPGKQQQTGQQQVEEEASEEGVDELLVGGLTLSSSSWHPAGGGGAGHPEQDEYLARPHFQHSLARPCVVHVTVPALPRGALLEVQPVLVAPEAMAQAPDGAEQQGPASSTMQAKQQQLKDCICSRTWCFAGAARRLVVVPAAAAGGGVATMQAVAAAAAGHMLGTSGMQPGAAATWRCWYVPRLLEEAGAAAGVVSQHKEASWSGVLHAALQQQAQAGQPSLVVQCVPVLEVHCELAQGPCCCVVEALWPCRLGASSGTRMAS